MDNEEPRALVVRQPLAGNVNDEMRIAKMFAESGYFPTARTQAQAYAKIRAGAELGIPPFAAMQGIDVIQGRTRLSATLIATLIQNSKRFSYRVRTRTDQACEIEFYEGAELLGVERFTIEDAKRARLLEKDNWRLYPKSMLFARAMSQGGTTYCPGVFAGAAVYTEDEIPSSPGEPNTVDADYSTVAEAEPLATKEQKEVMQRWFREQKMRGPQIDAWLHDHGTGAISVLTEEQADQVIALMMPLEPPAAEAQEDAPAPDADPPAA